MLIGGGGEKKTLKIVAEHADIWHSFSDAETLERKLGILGEHCERVGRDIDEIEISTELRSRSEADAAEAVELGTTLFTIGIYGSGLRPGDRQEVDRLARRGERLAGDFRQSSWHKCHDRIRPVQRHRCRVALRFVTQPPTTSERALDSRVSLSRSPSP